MMQKMDPLTPTEKHTRLTMVRKVVLRYQNNAFIGCGAAALMSRATKDANMLSMTKMGLGLV
jgi:hypothetical protein